MIICFISKLFIEVSISVVVSDCSCKNADETKFYKKNSNKTDMWWEDQVEDLALNILVGWIDEEKKKGKP